MTYETILYEQDGNMLTITLNRPDRLNAVTDVMLAELFDAFQRAGDDPSVRAVLLTGAGKGFCPGADLSAVQEGGGPQGQLSYGKHLRNVYNPLILLMRRMPKPIIGAINGAAAGAGMSLALACDMRIAAESATFVQAFVRIGLVPDSGSTWMLPRLIGSARALDLMLTGRKVVTQEALALGLVNRVVPDAELMDVARQVAREFAAAPTKAIGATKQALEFALTSTLEEALDYEAELQEVASHTADHMEGLRAFLEKRPPQFKGE